MSLNIGGYELKKEQLPLVALAAGALATVVIFAFLYLPVIKAVSTKNAECRRVETEAREAREMIATAGKIYGERMLISEYKIGVAMDALTKHGKVMGVNFISMKPGEIKDVPGARYKEISIEMRIESNDKQLADFMGSLDELKRGIVKIDSFDITPKSEDGGLLDSKLVIKLYISGHNYGK